MPIAGSPPRLSTHPDRFLAAFHPPSRSALTSNPHSLAAQPGPNFPRLRALALFGRLSAERAETLVAGVQKPAQLQTSNILTFPSAAARNRGASQLGLLASSSRLVNPLPPNHTAAAP